MDPRNDAQKAQRRPRRRAPAGPTDNSPETELQWLTARVPARLVHRMDDYAKESGTTRSDVLRDWLEIAEEALRERDSLPTGRFEQLVGGMDSIWEALNIIGPAVLGTRRLLAHWATRDSSIRVNEDELVNEVRYVSEEEWEEVLSRVEAAAADAAGPASGPQER